MPANAPVNAALLNKPVLRPGASGEAVRELQGLLISYARYINSQGILPGAIDGIYGEATRLAVVAFQEQVFLPTTGVVADLTWRSLFNRAPVDLPEVKFGEKSDYVLLLEQRLIRLGYLVRPADLLYDQRTLNAVSAFQRFAGLPQKSTVNQAMWFALSKLAIV